MCRPHIWTYKACRHMTITRDPCPAGFNLKTGQCMMPPAMAMASNDDDNSNFPSPFNPDDVPPSSSSSPSSSFSLASTTTTTATSSSGLPRSQVKDFPAHCPTCYSKLERRIFSKFAKVLRIADDMVRWSEQALSLWREGMMSGVTFLDEQLLFTDGASGGGGGGGGDANETTMMTTTRRQVLPLSRSLSRGVEIVFDAMVCQEQVLCENVEQALLVVKQVEWEREKELKRFRRMEGVLGDD